MCIGMLSPPKMPDPPKPPAAPPPAPTQDDPQINKEAEDRRKRILMAQGRQSTILSGSMGLLQKGQVLLQPRLLWHLLLLMLKITLLKQMILNVGELKPVLLDVRETF